MRSVCAESNSEVRQTKSIESNRSCFIESAETIGRLRSAAEDAKHPHHVTKVPDPKRRTTLKVSGSEIRSRAPDDSNSRLPKTESRLED